MIHWVEHSWKEEHSSPEDGPVASDIDEYEGVTAIEIVNRKASMVLVLGHVDAFIKGEGAICLEDLKKAQAWLHAYGSISNQLNAIQDLSLYMGERYGVTGPIFAAENRFMREAAEFAVASKKEPTITVGNGFALLDTSLEGRRCKMVWDTKAGGEFLGVINQNRVPRPTGMELRYAALDLWQIAMDNDFEYSYDDELEAAKDMRDSLSTHSLEDLSDLIRGSSIMIERSGS